MPPSVYLVTYGLEDSAVWIANGLVQMGSPQYQYCGFYVTKVPAPQSAVPKTVHTGDLGTGAKIKEFFYLALAYDLSTQAPLEGSFTVENTDLIYLGYSYGDGTGSVASNMVTFNPVSKGPASAVLFGAVDFPGATGFDADTLVFFLNADDPSPKGVCPLQNTPARVYAAPVECGLEGSPWYCPLNWQTCNPDSGFCFDKALLSAAQKKEIQKNTIPPTPVDGALFPNCISRQLLALHPVASAPKACKPDFNPAEEQINAQSAAKLRSKDTRNLEHRVLVAVLAAVVLAGIGLLFVLRASSKRYLSEKRALAAELNGEPGGEGGEEA